MTYLLDVNALVALALRNHQRHSVMHAFMTAQQRLGWATCAFTQAGFVRVASQNHTLGANPKSGMSSVFNPRLAASALAQNTGNPHHSYLAIDFDYSAVLSACTGGIVGHRQITDAWLLTLAIRKRLQLLSFDTGLRGLLATDAERSQHLMILQ
ncbi:MAG: TA system VapC family ribonuclease toxin [Burkholderiaceae bacterium]